MCFFLFMEIFKGHFYLEIEWETGIIDVSMETMEIICPHVTMQSARHNDVMGLDE